MLFSRRFSRTCLEGISFNFFVCFIFNVSLGSAPKRKNFDIQRNTRVGSGGQFTSNRLSNDHIYDFFRDIFSVFGDFSRFLGVKFGFQKSCLCKRNDKLDPVGSTVRYEMMKLCTGSV